jgi:hypothetical protein
MLATMLATVALAPSLSVSGHTLNWTPVGNGTYRVQVRTPGFEATNAIVDGTAYTPPERPGATVSYRVKARGESEWSNSVRISYPNEVPAEGPAEEPPREETPHEETPHEEPGEEPAARAMLPGVNAGTETADLTAASLLHVKVVRMPVSAREPAPSWFFEWIKRYTERGITVQPVVTFDARMLSPAEVQGLVAMDKLPGVKNIELGNETSFSYQYHDNWATPTYKERARLYAVRVKEAAEALNPHGIGVLAQAEDGGSGSANWVHEMFAAVPNLSHYVAGWTIHPYSNQHSSTQPDTYGVPKMERMVSNLAEENDTTTPIDVTEWGVASDNGAPLDNGTSLSYTEAGRIAETTIPKLVTAAKRHPIATFLVYQLRDERPQGYSSDHEYFFGVFNNAGGSKGGYTSALAKLMNE